MLLLRIKSPLKIDTITAGVVTINIVDRLSNNLAENINRNSTSSSSIPVLKFAISTTLNFIVVLSIVTVISLITGDVLRGLIAILAFSGLRYFSGGLHIKSANVCNVISALIVLISVYMPVTYWYNGLVLNIVSVVLLVWNAPSGIKRSKLPVKYYPVLKWISVVIVSANFFLHSPLVAMVFFIQAATTIPYVSVLLNRMKW
jgi:accessory gene regulator B